MTEGTPQTPEEIRQLNRDLMEKVLDKATSDLEWKQRLLDDPEAAMMEADFPEAEKLGEVFASPGGGPEVQGHQLCGAVGCAEGTVRFVPLQTFTPR